MCTLQNIPFEYIFFYSLSLPLSLLVGRMDLILTSTILFVHFSFVVRLQFSFICNLIWLIRLEIKISSRYSSVQNLIQLQLTVPHDIYQRDCKTFSDCSPSDCCCCSCEIKDDRLATKYTINTSVYHTYRHSLPHTIFIRIFIKTINNYFDVYPSCNNCLSLRIYSYWFS